MGARLRHLEHLLIIVLVTLGPESVRILEAFDSFALGVYADEHLYKIKWLHTVRWQEHAGLVLSVVELF